MSAPSPTTAPAAPPHPGARSVWRQVVVPAEHGAWAFLAEPVLLGLLVAPSWPGAALALATVAAFLARRPLRLALSDRRKGRRYPRTVAAERALVACAAVGAAALALALPRARGPALLPVALAAPLAALAMGLELRQRAREWAAEIAGALALGAAASAIALAAGWPAGPALTLWLVLAARAVPGILYVRARLRRARGVPAPGAPALLAHLAGVALVALLAARGWAPWLAVAALAVLGLRAFAGLAPWSPRLSTVQVGVSEAVFSALLVAATAAGYALRL